MDCRDVHERELLEGYLVGTLDERDQEVLEAHLFACDGCFREAETLRGIQGRLSELQHDVPRIATKPRATIRGWWWALGAVAVVTLLVAALIWWTAATAPQRAVELSAELAELARIEPPFYQPIRLRGAPDRAQQLFRSVMKRYTSGQYASAIPGLEEAARIDPDAANVSFYLGACYLLTGRISDGIVRLDHTIALGDTPFLEEALLLSSKANIQADHLDAARLHLKAVIELNGDLADEALELDDVIQKLG